MKLLAVLILASIPQPKLAPPPRPAVVQVQAKAHAKGGKWYMADDGHAIYCFGPEMMIPNSVGGIDKVATFCSGGKTVVKERE